jgi:putative transposase
LSPNSPKNCECCGFDQRIGLIGRRFKFLKVAHDFSHECVDIAADFGIGGQDVNRLLRNRAAIFEGYPKAIWTDNCPRFTGRAFVGWERTPGNGHLIIKPGKPMQNGCLECLN